MRRHLIALAMLSALLPAAALAQNGPPPGEESGPPPGATAAPPPGATTAPPPGATTAPPPGAISREEYIQRAEQRAARLAGERFDQIDVSHSGYITHAEIRAWMAQRRGGAANGPGGPPPQQ
jgi:hypothetical protein